MVKDGGQGAAGEREMGGLEGMGLAGDAGEVERRPRLPGCQAEGTHWALG